LSQVQVPLGSSEPERLIRLRELRHLTGLGRSTIYRLIEQGRFPKQLRPLGENVRLSVWRASEVRAWINARIAGEAA
jgi:prophage regulatory protein